MKYLLSFILIANFALNYALFAHSEEMVNRLNDAEMLRKLEENYVNLSVSLESLQTEVYILQSGEGLFWGNNTEGQNVTWATAYGFLFPVIPQFLNVLDTKAPVWQRWTSGLQLVSAGIVTAGLARNMLPQNQLARATLINQIDPQMATNLAIGGLIAYTTLGLIPSATVSIHDAIENQVASSKLEILNPKLKLLESQTNEQQELLQIYRAVSSGDYEIALAKAELLPKSSAQLGQIDAERLETWHINLIQTAYEKFQRQVQDKDPRAALATMQILLRQTKLPVEILTALQEQSSRLNTQINDEKAALSSEEDLYDKTIFKIKSAYEAKQYSTVLELTDTAINNQMKKWDIYYYRAISNENLKKYSEAMLDFNKSIEMRPNIPDTLLERGKLFLKLGNYSAAINDLTNNLNLNPSSLEGYNLRSNAYLKKGMFPQAIYDANQVIKKRPADNFALLNIAISYAMTKKLTNASLACNALKNTLNQKSKHLICTGVIEYKKGNFRASKDLFEKSIKSDPTYDEAYNHLGIVLDELGQYQIALKNYNIAIKLNGFYTNAYGNAATSCLASNSPLTAISYLNKAISLDPEYVNLYIYRGFSFSQINEFIRAFQDYDMAIELDPNISDIYIKRAATLLSLERVDEAFDDYIMAIKLEPNSPFGYFGLGLVQSIYGQCSEATKNFSKACSLGYSQSCKQKCQF